MKQEPVAIGTVVLTIVNLLLLRYFGRELSTEIEIAGVVLFNAVVAFVVRGRVSPFEGQQQGVNRGPRVGEPL